MLGSLNLHGGSGIVWARLQVGPKASNGIHTHFMEVVLSESSGQDDYQVADETLVDRGFRVQDPALALTRFSEQELPRLRETLPEYDDGIFQEALALTLVRLRENMSPPVSASAPNRGGEEE